MAKYVAKHVTQADGSRCQWTNCWAAVGAYLVRSGTRGRKKPTPMQFRKAAGAMKGCRTGGLGDLIVGCQKYGVKVTLLTDVTRANARRRLLKADSTKVYAFATDFDAWPVAYRCQANFDGYHMVAAVPWKPSPRMSDPLCKKLKKVPVKVVLNAAIEYNNEHGQKRNTIDMVVVTVPKK
jgi:hypothetical protein